MIDMVDHKVTIKIETLSLNFVESCAIGSPTTVVPGQIWRWIIVISTAAVLLMQSPRKEWFVPRSIAQNIHQVRLHIHLPRRPFLGAKSRVTWILGDDLVPKVVEYFVRPSKTFAPVEFSDVKVILPIVDAIFATDTRMPFLLDRLCVNTGIAWIHKMESVVDHEV